MRPSLALLCRAFVLDFLRLKFVDAFSDIAEHIGQPFGLAFELFDFLFFAYALGYVLLCLWNLGRLIVFNSRHFGRFALPSGQPGCVKLVTPASTAATTSATAESSPGAHSASAWGICESGCR